MEVKIRIESECQLPANQSTDFRINLENVECIGDLKIKLQPLLKVAACDMSVYYQTETTWNQKLENSQKISNLYVREGDRFIVKFVSICKFDVLSHILNDLKTFVREVCEKYSEMEGIYNIDEGSSDKVSEINSYYRNVIEDLEWCSYDLFVPWNYRPTNANRHYFAQEGGLQLLAKIHNFASKILNPFGDSKADIMKRFRERQLDLEVFCLLCIWNFSEIKEDRRLVLKTIGLDPFFYSLLKDPTDFEGIEQVEEYDIIRVNEASVGCLAQYVELSDIQQILAENHNALSKLVWLTSNSTNNDNYSKEVAANTIFCCSNHPKACTAMIKNKFHSLVLKKAKELELAEEKQLDLPFTSAIGYFFSLFLANIQTLPNESLLSRSEIQQINRVIDAFLHLVTPSEIGEFQKSHNYVWITLLPFVQLALAGPSGHLDSENETFQTRTQVSKEPSSEAESQSRNSRNDQCCDEECCETLGNQGTNESECQRHSRNDGNCDEGIFSNHKSPYTFSSAEKIGLFCLCHLVTTPENRELFRKEKLDDYLTCVLWFAKRCPEIVELTPKLDGFEQLEPPRLESIAKAYLSKCFGHKIM